MINKAAMSLFLCSVLGTASIVDAQQTGKRHLIGFLDSSTASGMAVLVDAFRQEMKKLGWVEGKNVAIEYRFAEGNRIAWPNLQRSWFV
jgi:putative ABC transport system substrate-binding protein